MFKFHLICISVAIFFLFTTVFVYADVKLIYPPDRAELTETEVLFDWENTDTLHEYLYQWELGINENWSGYISRPDLVESEYLRGLTKYSIYYWRVKYCLKSEIPCKYDLVSPTYVLGVNKELPKIIVEEVKPDPKEEEIKKNTSEEKVEMKEKIVTPKKEVIPKEIIEEYMDWNVNTQDAKILGAADTTKVCRFKYVNGSKKASVIHCDIPSLNITKSLGYSIYTNVNTISVQGTYFSQLNVLADEYVCKKDFLQPKSWFSCIEEFKETNTFTIYPNMSIRIYANDTLVNTLSFDSQGNSFNMYSGYFKDGKELRLRYGYSMDLGKYNIQMNGGGSVLLSPQMITFDTEKPFSFPFEELIGVTQWHGNTAYQKPHTGIDFGSTKENVLAVSNGEVIGKGWDSYKGECFSGGNYLLTKQSNGMYVAYFHLESIGVNVGKKIKTGDVLGVSGNTGAWNCQSLKSHLHFETRKGRNQSTHVNPVDYISVDWNKVLTLNSKYIPERLSGENPHPNF